MAELTPGRIQEIEELGRALLPEGPGSQWQLSEKRRLAIRELLEERERFKDEIAELALFILTSPEVEDEALDESNNKDE